MVGFQEKLQKKNKQQQNNTKQKQDKNIGRKVLLITRALGSEYPG